MLREDAQNEEQAVATVRDDRIRKDGVGGLRVALAAGQTADTQADFHGLAIHEFDQRPIIVSVDM